MRFTLPWFLLKIDNREFFPASKCASILGYSNPTSAVTRHCKHIFKHPIEVFGVNRETNFIPESDLFRFILKSKLPYAEQFEKWVFEEILPSIRANGIYATPEIIEEGLKDPNTIKKLLSELNEQRKQSNKLLEERETLLSTIESSKEKIHYHDVVLNNNTLIPITAIAKDYGISDVQMNKILNTLKEKLDLIPLMENASYILTY